MWLEIDAGNTRIKWRLSAGPELGNLQILDQGAVTVGPNGEGNLLDIAHRIVRLSTGEVKRVLVSNVRGADFAGALRSWSLQEFTIDPEFAVSCGQCRGVKNGYESPGRLGVDRWLGIVAAYNKTQSSCCIVDCGTTITVDAVNSGGVHVGGYIVPGLQMMKAALQQKSAVLQARSSHTDSLVPGRTTEDAINHGVLAMVVGLAELIRHADFVDSAGCQWLLTGGDAALVAPFLPFAGRVDESLVLDGLRLYFSDNQKTSL